MIKVDFEQNPSLWDIANPRYHINEYRAMARGEFTVTPSSLLSHIFTTSVGGVAGYRLTQWAISRGLPIGPLEPWKVLKGAHTYRTISAPARWSARAGQFIVSRAFLPVAFISLVAYTGMNEPSRTDTSLNIPYNPIHGRHSGR